MKPPPLRLRPGRRHSGSAESKTPAERDDGLLTPAEWICVAKALLLAPRELELVRCLFQSKSHPAIAQALGVTPRRMHTYLGRLYRKLGVHSRAGAMLRVFAAYTNFIENSLPGPTGPHTPQQPDQPA